LTSRTTNTFRKLMHSRLAVALPVTFLILFITSLGLVSATYYFSIQKIGSESQIIKITAAKADFISLNDKILSTIWNPGSSSTINIKDSGGLTRIQPDSNQLLISVDDASSIHEEIFASSIGKVIYELPYSVTSQAGVFLEGDSRPIVNQTGSTQSQMSIVRGVEHPEIHLSYRPVVCYSAAGLENGKQLNNIRIYVINLNSSTSIDSQGELPLRVECLDAQLTTKSYEFSSQPPNLTITASKEDSVGTVVIPLSSNAQGAIVNIELVVVNVAIERWIR
jgi:hypothetical protein